MLLSSVPSFFLLASLVAADALLPALRSDGVTRARQLAIDHSRPLTLHPQPQAASESLLAGTRRKSVSGRAPIIVQNEKTKKFIVDGKKIPDVDFDIGESYAGLLPTSEDENDPNKLFFWFFPAEDPSSQDTLTIWLNGGPGCSSLAGFLQENGRFLWLPGTFRPVSNPFSWTNLTNMLWVEQPAGTGFSTTFSPPKNEVEVAEQFLGFFKNFIDTFELPNKKISITGESYAGYYVPYIADAMITASDKKYYDLKSIWIIDPSTTYDSIQQQVPALPLVDAYPVFFNLNVTFMTDLRKRAGDCGYTDYQENYFKFPPDGPLPTPPNPNRPGCDIWLDIIYATRFTNPCFNIYDVGAGCPLLWDVLGFPSSFFYVPPGSSVYFNRTDVQKAINAPEGKWEICTDGILRPDGSPPSGLSVLPRVIEHTNRTLISHGSLDYILIANGTLLMIQNMTFNGGQGFSEYPSDPLYVPYHDFRFPNGLSGAGIMGRTRTERGLTYAQVTNAGHMIPEYQAAASYRQLEFVLGKIDSLSEVGDFTTEKGMNSWVSLEGNQNQVPILASGRAQSA